jgi:hypothetical protein
MLRHARPAVRDFGLGLGHCMGMLLLLLFGLWIAVLGATEANPSKAGMNAETAGADSGAHAGLCRTGTEAGFVTLVARDEQLASLSAAGYQDLESKTPMRTDTISRSCR